MSASDVWAPIVEEVRLYPSPHNSQPIKLRPLTEQAAQIYYDLDLGLPAENFGIPFAHVCAGVFLESLRVIAAAHGFAVVESLSLEEMDFSSKARLHSLGTVSLVPQEVSPEATRALALFKSRRTSRRPYEPTLVPPVQWAPVKRAAERAGHVFRVVQDQAVVDEIIQVNQRTLFSDLNNEPVYKEIMTWLRFDKQEAKAKKDGLSAETMLMPGNVLRYAMSHRGLWNAPVVGPLVRKIYLNTMRGVKQVGYFQGPFSTPSEYVEAGRLFMASWLLFEAAGIYLHPFGTVITNPTSHEQFVKAAQVDESGDTMAWMLFRFGYSKKPPLAFRREGAAMLIEEAW